MTRCQKCQWKQVAVFVYQKCFMLNRCKICNEFGRTYVLVYEPWFDSVNINPDELSQDFLDHIKTIALLVEDCPVYFL